MTIVYTIWKKIYDKLVAGITVVQTTAASLKATVYQSTASNLKSEVSQGTAANLKATVYQGTATNLKAEVFQSDQTELKCKVYQADAIVIQPMYITDNDIDTLTTAGTRYEISDENSTAIIIKSLKSNTGLVYIGDSAVTTSNGFELEPGEAISLDIDTGVTGVFAVSDTNNQKVCWLQVYEP